LIRTDAVLYDWCFRSAKSSVRQEDGFASQHDRSREAPVDAADELRANSKLKASEYGEPVLGLIFLRHADACFTEAQKRLQGSVTGRRSQLSKHHYQAEGVVYVPEEARFSHLLRLPEGEDLGRALNEAMRLIEEENEDLKGVLPRAYARLETKTLVELLKLMASIPTDIEGDAIGRIYEYFLGKFAMAEGHKGGEFFTPTSLVRLIVEIIEPWHGRIYDPACGSGGMFVQSARFVEEHRKDPGREISIYGQERAESTVRLQHEPRRARPRGRHPRGQQLLRGPARRAGPLRLRHG
jgi:type I restriction enzyme M protein